MACLSLTSCGLFKNRATFDSIDKAQAKDSIRPRANTQQSEQNTAVMEEPKKEPVRETPVRTTSKASPTTHTTIAHAYHVVPLPPLAIEKAFNATFPSAKNVVWTKVKPFMLLDFKCTSLFKVNFSIQQTKNIAIYDENTEILEMREEIIPEQLPPNVYSAIKSQYPSGFILSATALRKSKSHGAYAAVVRPFPEEEQIEVILMENGSIVR